MGTTDERTWDNTVSRFFMYMCYRWCEDECKLVFTWNYKHFWDKWRSFNRECRSGSTECFYSALDKDYRRRLVERACQVYDENLRIIPTTQTTDNDESE